MTVEAVATGSRRLDPRHGLLLLLVAAVRRLAVGLVAGQLVLPHVVVRPLVLARGAREQVLPHQRQQRSLWRAPGWYNQG